MPIQQYIGLSVNVNVLLLLILSVHCPLIMKFESVVHSCLQAYYRAARACHGRGDRIQAMKYLSDGIEKCDNSYTEDLRRYLWMLVGDGFPCTYFNSSSDQ